MSRSTRLVPVLLGICAVMFAAAPYVIDTAPYESVMGLVQRIFYFHLPAALLTLLSAIICGVASGVYLARRTPTADHIAVAAAELVVLFGLMVFVTGPLWERKTWGHWWIWDARVIITLVMWLVFNAYLLLRRFGGPGSEVLASAVGFFGMALVPFVYWSVNMWRTLHPKTTVVPNLPPTMMGPMVWSLTAFFFLYVVLMFVRVRLESVQTDLDRAFLALEELS